MAIPFASFAFAINFCLLPFACCPRRKSKGRGAQARADAHKQGKQMLQCKSKGCHFVFILL
jgi:hypothetical protein